MASPNYSGNKRSHTEMQETDSQPMQEDGNFSWHSDSSTPSASEEEYTPQERLEGLDASLSYAFQMIRTNQMSLAEYGKVQRTIISELHRIEILLRNGNTCKPHSYSNDPSPTTVKA